MNYNQEHQDTEAAVKKSRKFTTKQFTVLVVIFALLCGTAVGGVWLARSFTIGQPEISPVQLSVATTHPLTTPATTAPGTTTPATTNVPSTTDAPNGEYAALVNGTEVGQVLTPAEIYARYVGSVVGVVTEGTTQNIFGQTSRYAVSGTGFVITSDGYIITNSHVVNGGSTFTVSFEDGSSYDAKLIGDYPANDVALLKIEAEGLTPVTLGDSRSIHVGEDIVAIGNPLGELTFSLSKGVVSALNRLIATRSSEAKYMFQLDAAVNSGNSGGPVFNRYGQVIGVVTAKYTETGTEGLGFALPINDVLRIVTEFLENGTLRTSDMGVTVRDMSKVQDESDSSVEGVWIAGVDEGSAAETAGLLVGDIIIKVDDMRITSVSELKLVKKTFFAGDAATLTVVRDGETLTLNIVFGEAVEEEAPAQTQQPVQPEQTMPVFPGVGGWY